MQRPAWGCAPAAPPSPRVRPGPPPPPPLLPPPRLLLTPIPPSHPGPTGQGQRPQRVHRWRLAPGRRGASGKQVELNGEVGGGPGPRVRPLGSWRPRRVGLGATAGASGVGSISLLPEVTPCGASEPSRGGGPLLPAARAPARGHERPRPTWTLRGARWRAAPARGQGGHAAPHPPLGPPEEGQSGRCSCGRGGRGLFALPSYLLRQNKGSLPSKSGAQSRNTNYWKPRPPLGGRPGRAAGAGARSRPRLSVLCSGSAFCPCPRGGGR